MERIEDFYSELYDSDQAVTIQTDPKEVPPIMAREVEAALRKMKNGKEATKAQVNIETLKAGNRKDIENYRPICLQSNMYKVFTKITTTRLEKKLDENQPREHASVRSKYFTLDCVLLSWITRRHLTQYKPTQY